MRRLVVGLVLAVGLLTSVAGTIYFRRIDRFWGITQTDFSVFYDAGYRFARRDSLYTYRPTRYTTNPEYLFKYAPPFALAMTPLARLDINDAIRWWYALTGLALLGALLATRALLRGGTAPGAELSAGTALWPVSAELPMAAWLFLLVAIARPYLATLRLGQLDVILAALLLGFVWAMVRGRDLLAGWCLGAAIVCKLVPALWLIYLAATRRWRALAWTAVAVAVALASPIPHLGIAGTGQAIREWLAVLGTAGGNWEWLVRYKNQSVLSFILRMMTGTEAAAVTPMQIAVAAGLTGCLAIVWGWSVWRLLRRTAAAADPLARLAAPGLVFIAMIIFSPHAWKATFIHLLLPYAVLLADLVTRTRRQTERRYGSLASGRRDRVGWGLLGGSFLLVSVSAPDVLLGSHLAHTVDLLAPMMWGALLLAIGLWRVSRRQEVRAGR